MSDLMVTLSHNELQCHHLPGVLTGPFEEGGGVSLCPGVFWPLQGGVGQRKVLGLGANQLCTGTWLYHLPAGGDGGLSQRPSSL